MRECFSHVHTCEHILNRTMVNMFGCPRSRNAHVEKKKSKCDYILSAESYEWELKITREKMYGLGTV